MVDNGTFVSVDDLRLVDSCCGGGPGRETPARGKLYADVANCFLSRAESSNITGRDIGSDMECCIFGGGTGVFAYSSSTRSTLAGGEGGGGPMCGSFTSCGEDVNACASEVSTL